MPEMPSGASAGSNDRPEGTSIAAGDTARYRQRLGSLLRQRRRSIEPPITQKDVAQQLGLAQSAVSDWERGETWPSVPSLLALIRLLGIDPADLLEVLDDGHPNGEDRAA